MCKKLILLILFMLVLSLAPSVWSFEILIDDDFNGGGVESGDATSINGGFTLVPNAPASAGTTAVEKGSNIEVNTINIGPSGNANAGIVCNTSIDPLSPAALAEGLTVRWVVTSHSASVAHNGNTFVVQPSNVFFNSIGHVGLQFNGKSGAGVAMFYSQNGSAPTGILSSVYAFEEASWMDGFTAQFTLSAADWSFTITGLNDNAGVPSVIGESGPWSDGFSLENLLNHNSYASAHAQVDGSNNLIVSLYDRCMIWVGELPENDPSNPQPSNKAVDVPQDTLLSWTAGKDIGQHNVYLGKVSDDVANATAENLLGVLVSPSQDPCSYDPSILDFGATYFWRIDEIGLAPDFTVYPGPVWEFTVETFAYPIAGETITATASGVSSPSEGPENTINSSGLDANDLHSSSNEEMWLSNPADPNPAWIQYEFDRIYKLHEMLVWNHNSTFELGIGLGIKEAVVAYSVDGENWTELGVSEFKQGTAEDGLEAGTTVDLTDVVAKYVRITANSNWGGQAPHKGLSEVRFSYVPVWARELNPIDGAIDVGVENSLFTWRAGREAASHEVYLSTDMDVVINGTVDSVNVTESSYTVDLDLDTMYHWRVDEVNTVEIPAINEGSVQSFTTQASLLVDDMESYSITEGEEIYVAWVDGFPDNHATNGALVGNGFYGEPEKEIVRSGSQAMPMEYGLNNQTISEVTRTFEDAPDWSKHGIRSLSLYFRGTTLNTVGQLYIKINGTKYPYPGSSTDIQSEEWLPFNVDLSGVTVVNTLVIGVEGGLGKIYLDDICLNPTVL